MYIRTLSRQDRLGGSTYHMIVFLENPPHDFQMFSRFSYTGTMSAGIIECSSKLSSR
ncbi:hypothetical protein BRADI_2g55045v3 [Brachypodium distachyon]|uniref:Uncharacterized protein n=1 Tax=Brachypodium distachyon TaxID=15368 RepID=A0A2K2DFY9_BRADI|nr:hypothetical protein BRADI_2g55045v3 [Brachypodium distachyon]